jgi:YVTN family beta-propeller protein
MMLRPLIVAAGMLAAAAAPPAPATPATRGAQRAQERGCLQCHSPGNLASPGWESGADSLVANEAEVQEWILRGMPRRIAALPAPSRPVWPQPMPAYDGRLGPGEVEDLQAWFKALSGFDTSISDPPFEGRALASKLGCFGCHGPSGMGTAATPAWDGALFAERVRDEAELREWLLEGKTKRSGPTRMPGFAKDLSDDQVGLLVAYVQWLRRPATAAEPPKPPAPASLDPMGLTGPITSKISPSPEGRGSYRSPTQLVVSRDGATAYVVDQTGDRVAILDLARRKLVADISVGSRPTHAALSPDGRTLYVSCQFDNRVDVIDLRTRKVVRALETGWEPQGVALTADGKRLFVTNYLADSVSIIDVEGKAPRHDVKVARGPRFVALSADGRRAVVSNGLGRSVSILDQRTGEAIEHRSIRGSSILRDVVISKDGRWAFVAHVLARDEFTPFQMERGWIASNGFSILDLDKPGHRVTLLLDQVLAGASNPYGLALSADGKTLFVSISGTHELALVDVAGAIALAKETPEELVERRAQDVEILQKRGIARRFPAGGYGPRGIAVRGSELLVAQYFEEAIGVFDARTGAKKASIPLEPKKELTPWRRGELYFTDAPSITFQGWFSCVSCHEEDGGSDGLNWDLPNDGTGNPKNVKSLHDAYDTPPSMWTGVRRDLDAATAAGARFQGFLPKPGIHEGLVAYLSDPPRAPNPWRKAIAPERLERGKAAYSRARCDVCHPGPTFSDLKKHDLGLGAKVDLVNRFDTQSLRETYRTGPYLHDGRAPTLESIFRDHDAQGLHGLWKRLSQEEFADLMAYLRSL